MGLFNAVFKGVRVEKRKPKTRSKEAEMDVAQLSTDFVEPVQNEPVIQEQGPCAASILFENTERFGNQPNSYDTNQFAPSQFGTANYFGGTAIGGSAYNNRNILVVTPSTNAEVTKVITNLRNGDACIVCLEGLDITAAQRRLDFLSGIICAMNGTLERLNANTYILTPTGIGVRKPQ